jgi:hypothetical protein
MDISFSTAALAALCNSERRLAQRWGAERGRTVARRLLDIAAGDTERLNRLPGASVSSNAAGETILTFGTVDGDIVVRGTIRSSKSVRRAARTDTDQIVITSVDVEGKSRA